MIDDQTIIILLRLNMGCQFTHLNANDELIDFLKLMDIWLTWYIVENRYDWINVYLFNFGERESCLL